MNSRSDVPNSKNDLRKKKQIRLLNAPLSSLKEPEGEHLPASLPFTVDAHVHLFPEFSQLHEN